jgi:hypothetical protein
MTTQYIVLKGLPNGLTFGSGKLVSAPDTLVSGNTFSFSNRTNANTQYVVSVVRSAVLAAGDYTFIAYIGSDPKAEIAVTFAGTDGETATETAKAAELDSATLVQLQAIEDNTDASVWYLTTLVTRITSNAATALANLFAMITGSGASAQFTALALENAPTGGAGEGGGLTEEQDELLTKIGARTAQITGSRLQVIGAVTPGGDISLIVGSDYVEEIDSSLTRTITDAGAVLHGKLTGGELTELIFRAATKAKAPASERITGTIMAVSHSSGVTSVTIEIDRSDIPNGPFGGEWKYQIWREADSLVTPPLLEGGLRLDWRT